MRVDLDLPIKKHSFKQGDLVWWKGVESSPVPFAKGEPFIGIVVNTSQTYEGVEVFWFNNEMFKVINYEDLMLAEPVTFT